MHRSTLCEAVLGWKPLAPPLFPVVTFPELSRHFLMLSGPENPKNTPFYCAVSTDDGRLDEHP